LSFLCFQLFLLLLIVVVPVMVLLLVKERDENTGSLPKRPLLQKQAW
jgi:hypothetical protein